MTIVPPFPAYRDDQPYAFVSYAHADRHLVYPIITDLYGAGYRIWYDEGIEPTESWPRKLADAIAGCRLYVVFVSKVSVEREGVDREIEWAHRCGLPILAVCLEETPLPSELAFLTGKRQHLAYRRQDQDELITTIRATLDSADHHGVGFDLRGEARAVSGTVPTTPVNRGQRPGRASKKRQRKAVSEVFVDRICESEGLSMSVDRQLRRLTGAEDIEDGVYANVLVFHGGGGIGKSGLSERLEAWTSGGLADTAEWGTWPHADTEVISVRWDFNDAVGNLNLTRMLQALRAALADTDHDWYAFDVALAAYLEAVGGSSEGILSGRAADGVLRSLQVVAAQLRQSPPMSLTGEDIRRVASRVRNRIDRPSVLSGNDVLLEVLDEVRLVERGRHVPEIVADLMFLLTGSVYDIEPRRRPAMMFFLDHFERIQRSGSAGADAIIASFVMELSYALFVITGRDRVNWDDPRRVDLAVAGPTAWPGLVPGVLVEPRQHLLERLSDQDTRYLYERYQQANGWDISPQLIDALVVRSAGLPLHIDAVLTLARNLNRENPGVQLTAGQLDGELPFVVSQLLRVLTTVEARAFRAACVLPSFDIELAAAVGQVDGGDVTRAITFALVESSGSDVYPYRVHDAIRDLVQRDRNSVDYWTELDWTSAARRGLDEAIRRIHTGHERGSDEEQLEGIALAIRLGYEWELYAPGLAELVHNGPSIAGLMPLIPTLDGDHRRSDIADILRLVHAIALPFPEGAEALDGMAESVTNREIARYVTIWRIYRHRSLFHREAALRAMRLHMELYPEFAEYNTNQYPVCLRQFRRFRDALDYVEVHRPDLFERFDQSIRRVHGVAVRDGEILRKRLAAAKSRRYRLELEVTDLVVRVRSSGVDAGEVETMLGRAIDLGARAEHRQCLLALGLVNLARDTQFGEIAEQLRSLMASYGSMSPSFVQLLAVRALYTRDPADAKAAFDAVQPYPDRSDNWILAEVWLEELGYPLPPVETQWLISPADVRANWLRIADGIIDRAVQYAAEVGR